MLNCIELSHLSCIVLHEPSLQFGFSTVPLSFRCNFSSLCYMVWLSFMVGPKWQIPEWLLSYPRPPLQERHGGKGGEFSRKRVAGTRGIELGAGCGLGGLGE